MDAGMDDFLTKPLEPKKLEQALTSLVLAGVKEDDRTDQDANTDLPLLDPARLEALRDMGADASRLVERVVASYTSSVDASLENLRAVALAGDGSGLAQIAHRLRGSSANLGAVRVSELCLQLETRGRAGETDGLEPLIARLTHAVHATVADLQLEIEAGSSRRSEALRAWTVPLSSPGCPITSAFSWSARRRRSPSCSPSRATWVAIPWCSALRQPTPHA